MADPASYQQALIDAGQRCAQACEAAVTAAMATAGLLSPDQLPSGAPMPNKNLTDASSIAALANNAAEATLKVASALDMLQSRPLKTPGGVVPDLYPPPPSEPTTP